MYLYKVYIHRPILLYIVFSILAPLSTNYHTVLLTIAEECHVTYVQRARITSQHSVSASLRVLAYNYR